MSRPCKLDPRICNIHLDANALDRNVNVRVELIDRLLELSDSEEINLIVPGSVRSEICNPNTPLTVQRTMGIQIYTQPVCRTSEEVETLSRIQNLLRGNAQSDKHNADSEHIFESSKYGGGYFVTNDKRILKKRTDLERLTSPTFSIVTLGEFLDCYDYWVSLYVLY